MRWRRLLLVAVAVGGGLLGALSLVGARVPQAALVAELERALGYPLEVGRARVRFLPRPTLELLDVRATTAGIVAGSVATFEVERLRLRLALIPLLGGRAIIDRVLFEAPLLRVVRPAAGHGGPPAARGAAVPEVLRPAKTRAPSGQSPAETRREAGGRDTAAVRVRRVDVHKGRVQFIDEATSGRWAAGRMRVTVDLPGELSVARPRAHVALRATLRRGGREPLAEVALDGWLVWDEGRPRFRGAIESGPFVFGPLRFDGGSAALSADPRGAHLRDLELRLGGGAVAGRARAVLGESPGVALGVAGRGEALEDAFDQAKIVVGGAWEARLALRGPAQWWKRARRGLRGYGRLVIRDGAIEPFELGSGLLDVLAPLRGREQSQQLRARYPDLFDESRLGFVRLGGTFRVTGGRVRTQDLVLRGDAYRAAVRGTVSVDGRLGLAMQVALSAALTEDLLGRGGLAAVIGAQPGRGLTVPLRLEGTVRHPRVRARPEWSRALIRRTLGGSGMGDLLERLLR